MKLVILILGFSFSTFADLHEEVFTETYEKAIWGVNEKGQGWSGGGASFENTVLCRSYIEKVIKEEKIQSVLDLGCGDWESTQSIDWNGAQYLGIDVVKPVIKKNIEEHENENIHFLHANFLAMDLPEADLLICKHVCQHISNQDVENIIQQLDKFKHCIFINPVDPITKTSENVETDVSPVGRIIDLLAAPFNLHGEVFFYELPGGSLQQVLHIQKERN